MTRVDSLLEAYELKDELRSGWVLRGIEDPESVAAHTWGTAMLCLLFADEAGINPNEAVSMALVHDLAEARTGDIPTRAEEGAQRIHPDTKEQQEKEVMRDLANGLASQLFQELWEEYEARNTPLSQFTKDMDLIDNCLQALKYERQERYDKTEDNENFIEYDHLDEFFATAEPRIQTDIGEELFTTIEERYRNQFDTEVKQ
ncbi:HD domain-containing protein [Halocatena pleomorpha]|uniref:5'-deoxynucleotidase n=1 Tax=Halocatena pleomorpha TaxID=1785090 RepID=A0A3P3R5I7_9EURY|nr:HD family hydrolase [Halocatena pleomorpha]RRJ28706.1 HD family hydrolase [Halocatena pleomorpha]